ncbi:Uncharacterized protein FWK35_00018881, partial [Aphis craccivora]
MEEKAEQALRVLYHIHRHPSSPIPENIKTMGYNTIQLPTWRNHLIFNVFHR